LNSKVSSGQQYILNSMNGDIKDETSFEEDPKG